MTCRNRRKYAIQSNYVVLTSKQFMCCKDAFMGGYTHANYIYMGEVMHNVDSFDYGSASDHEDTLAFFSVDTDDGE